MSSHNPSKRDYLLPAGCKDLVDALQTRKEAVPPPPAPYPPITTQVGLPAKVSVRFLAEVSGQDLHTITRLMSDLRIIVSASRSVDFADAQRILRMYGIWAETRATNA
jgi:hypothetical protein